LVILLVRGAFVVGLVASDDARYTDAAWKLASGLPAGVYDHAYVRAAFVGWLSLWLKLGLAPSQLWIAQLVTEILLGLAIVRFATLFVPRWPAFLAAVCWTLFPVGLVYGGIVLPDQFALMLALLGTTECIKVLRSGSAPFRTVVLAGFPLGLAVSAKEPFALVLPIVGLWAMVRSQDRLRDLRILTAIGLASVATFALEYPFFRIWTGDWLYHHHALAAEYGEVGAQQREAVLNRDWLLYYLDQVLLKRSVSGFWGWLGLASLFLPSRETRDRAFLLVWAVVFFLYLQYGTTDLSHYNPVPRQPRYIEPVFIGFCVTLAALAVPLARRGRAGWVAGVLALAGLAVHSGRAARMRLAADVYHADRPRAVAAARLVNDSTGLIIPNWLPTRLPVDWRSFGTPMDSLGICARLARPAEAGISDGAALLLPDRWTRGRHGCAISPGWAVEPLRWPVAGIDRLLAGTGIEQLKSLAQTRHVGDLAVWHAQGASAGSFRPEQSAATR